ncbi:MAG: ATP-binding protein [Rhodospirillales bacterium]
MEFSAPTAVISAAIASLVLFGGLLHVGMSPGAPRGIRWWWLAIGLSCARYVLLYAAITTRSPLLQFAAESCQVLSAIFLAVGALVFLGHNVPRRLVTIACLACIGWAWYTTLIEPSFLLRSIPLYGLSGLLIFGVGVVLYRAGNVDPNRGYRLSGILFILWGLHKLDYPLLRPVEWFAPYGFIIAMALQMALTVSLIIVVQRYSLARLAAEEQRRHRAERDYRNMFENLNIGIYRSLPGGDLARANPAFQRMHGYTDENEMLESVRRSGPNWYPDPGRRDEFLAALDRDGFVENFESEIHRHKTRERIWVSENAYTVRDKTGAPLHFEGTMVDITARKEAERRLRDALRESEVANRAKTDFLASMSHELRTPLNAILGFSQIMANESFGEHSDPKYREYADDIVGSSQHLLSIINDVLDLSKVEAGEMTVNAEDVPLQQAIRDIAKPFQLRGDGRNAQRIRIVVDDDSATVLTDPRYLRQILTNLLSNADKYTPEDGDINVIADRAADGRTRIRVIDTGVGIAPEDIGTVLEPFGQARLNVTVAHEGTGLGLSLSKVLMEMQGGELLLESEPGVGTTVTLLFAARASV